MSDSPLDKAGEQDSFAVRQTAAVRRLLSSAGDLAEGAAVDPTPLGPPPAGGQRAIEAPPFRVVVATDLASESFSAAAAVPAVLLAFSQMFTAGDPVNLVLALDHEPDDRDADAAKQLLGRLRTDRRLAGVSLESFTEARQLPTYVGVVPRGDAWDLVQDLSAALIGMHLLAETITDPARLQLAMVNQLLLVARGEDELGPRLAGYREVELPRS